MRSNAKFYLSAFLLTIAMALPGASANAQGQSPAANPFQSTSVHACHVLGFESERRNVAGELSINGDSLQFQRHGQAARQVAISSIQKVSVGQQDKQVGGIPMTVGKAAIPFGGGRVVSLFSHKKYDSLSLEYVDASGALHGAVFLLQKGQAETFKEELAARGSKAKTEEVSAPVLKASQDLAAGEPWSIQVDPIDAGTSGLDPSFSNAIYENLLKEFTKSKQFKSVFRSRDRGASDASGVLVLKTAVQKYTAGSETKRAVTTVAGATKIEVHVQLVKPDGTVLLERNIQSNVRFFGDNMRATSTLARKVAKAVKPIEMAGPLWQQADAQVPSRARSWKTRL